MKYRLIRSGRRTLSLEIGAGELIVRAPLNMSREHIESFIEKKTEWIKKRLKVELRQNAEAERAEPIGEAEIAELKERAKSVIPPRAEFFAKKLGVSYRRISVRCQRTRWGSCSGKGNLNFNCLLMLALPEVLDAVVAHELCHIRHMDHSRAFYAELIGIYPEYFRWDRWLKENGPVLLKRIDRG